VPVSVELERTVAPRDRSVREHDRVARVAAQRRAARGQSEDAAGVEAGLDDELERPLPRAAGAAVLRHRRERGALVQADVDDAPPRGHDALVDRDRRGDLRTQHGVQELAERRLRVAQGDFDLAVARGGLDDDPHQQGRRVSLEPEIRHTPLMNCSS
jgi:hypothetical protein